MNTEVLLHEISCVNGSRLMSKPEIDKLNSLTPGGGGDNKFSKIYLEGDGAAMVKTHPMFGDLDLITVSEVDVLVGNPVSNLVIKSSSLPQFIHCEQSEEWKIQPMVSSPLTGTSWSKTVPVYPGYDNSKDGILVFAFVINAEVDVKIILVQKKDDFVKEVYNETVTLKKMYSEKHTSLAYHVLNPAFNLDNYYDYEFNVVMVKGTGVDLCGDGFPSLSCYMTRDSRYSLVTDMDLQNSTVQKSDIRAFKIEDRVIENVDTQMYNLSYSSKIEIPDRANGLSVVGIADSVFNHMATTTVYVPPSITSVGSNNFSRSYYTVIGVRGPFIEQWCKDNNAVFVSDGTIPDAVLERMTPADKIIRKIHRESGEWLMEYASGYMEQGGYTPLSGDNEKLVTFLEPMVGDSWYPILTIDAQKNQVKGGSMVYASKKTTSEGTVVNPELNFCILADYEDVSNMSGVWWKICGMKKK